MNVLTGVGIPCFPQVLLLYRSGIRYKPGLLNLLKNKQNPI